MSFSKFCPKCGKETTHLVGKVCPDCFLKGKKIFQIKKPIIRVCQFCNKLFLGNVETNFSEETIAEEIASKTELISELDDPKVFVELKRKTNIDFEALIKVKGFLANFLVEQEKVVNFQLKETTCDACMKLNADYREAILQLRAKDKKDQEAMLKIAQDLLSKENLKDSLSGTSKIIELKTGFDLWIGSKKAAVKVSKYLSNLYKVPQKVSSKLIGEDPNGKRKYRFTFCIKID